MKKIYLLAILLFPFVLHAQTSSDLLEKPTRVDKHNEIRLKFENGVLKYQSVFDQPGSYLSFADSLFFLTGEGVNLRIVPLNPLNLSTAITIKETANLNSDAESAALKQIQDYAGKAFGGAAALAPGNEFNDINDALTVLEKSLKENTFKQFIAERFIILKSIDFDRVDQATNKLTTVKKDLDDLKAEYKKLDDEIKRIKGLIAIYPAADPNHDAPVVTKVFTTQLNELTQLYQIQFKNVEQFESNWKLVNEVKSNSKIRNEEMLTLLQEISVNQGKTKSVTITVNQDGFKLTDSKDIVAEEKKTLYTRTLRLTRFKRWIFEAASGIAFTTLKYPKFGTGTDEAGNTIVTDAGEENFKRLNLTAMFNWNYYIPKSNVHPFFQIGLGANAEYPALLTGLGLRIGSDNGSHFAISGGFASSWIKTLNKLKIGDKVSGTAELEKDISHEFKWPLKQYIGIQYNF